MVYIISCSFINMKSKINEPDAFFLQLQVDLGLILGSLIFMLSLCLVTQPSELSARCQTHITGKHILQYSILTSPAHSLITEFQSSTQPKTVNSRVKAELVCKIVEKSMTLSLGKIRLIKREKFSMVPSVQMAKQSYLQCDCQEKIQQMTSWCVKCLDIQEFPIIRLVIGQDTALQFLFIERYTR